MIENYQEGSHEAKETSSLLTFSIRDNVGILLNDGSRVTINFDSPKLASCLKGDLDLLQRETTIPIFMGSRSVTEVLQEKMGATGPLINTLSRIFFVGSPNGFFWSKEGNEFLYFNTPIVLTTREGEEANEESGKEKLAKIVAHELGHLQNYFSQSGRRATRKDGIMGLGFMFCGGANGFYLTMKIFNRLIKDEKRYSKREFLKNVSFVSMVTAGVALASAYNRVYYDFLSNTEREAGGNSQSRETLERIKDAIEIHTELKEV